jgi:hypothetical protein
MQVPQLTVQERLRVPIMTPAGHAAEDINDALATGERVIVVEGETNSLVVLSLDGRTLSTMPNTGPGAPRLGFPNQLALSQQGELLVLDAQTPRLARFSVRGDSLTLSSVLRLQGMTAVSGMCSLGGRVFIVGITPPTASSKLVHTIGEDGEVTSSFGEVFGPSDQHSRLLYGHAQLLCMTREGLVVIASDNYPEVRAYDEHGTLLWSREIPDFRQVSYQKTARGGVRFVTPADGLWDSTVSVFSPAEGMVAVQIGRRRGQGSDTPFSRIETRILSALDGRQLAVQHDLPLVKGTGASRLFAVDEAGSLSFLSYTFQRD